MLNKRHLFFLLLIFSATAVSAEQEPSLEKSLIKSNITYSERIDSFAKDLDVFLAGDNFSKEANKTRITIRQRLDWSERNDFSYSPALDARLHLPNLESKFQIRFTSYESDNEESGINRNRIQSEERQEAYGANLIFAKKLANFDVRFQPKLRFINGVKFSHSLEFRSEAKLKDISVSQRIELFGRYDQGTGQLYGLYFYYNFNDYWLLGFTNEEESVDQESLFSTNHSVFIAQQISEKMNLRYGNIYESDNQPHFRLQKYTYYASFTHLAYKNVVHYSLTPRLEFDRKYSFSGFIGAQLELNIIF